MDNLSGVAQAVLTLAAAGVPVPEMLVDQLAREVLQAPAVELARAVAAGGPHKLLRAVELAEVLMAEKRGGVEAEERRVLTAG